MSWKNIHKRCNSKVGQYLRVEHELRKVLGLKIDSQLATRNDVLATSLVGGDGGKANEGVVLATVDVVGLSAVHGTVTIRAGNVILGVFLPGDTSGFQKVDNGFFLWNGNCKITVSAAA